MKKKLLKQKILILSKENEKLRDEAHKSFWGWIGNKPTMPSNYDVLNAVTDHLEKEGFTVKQCEHEFNAVERNKGVQLDYVAKCSKCGFEPTSINHSPVKDDPNKFQKLWDKQKQEDPVLKEAIEGLDKKQLVESAIKNIDEKISKLISKVSDLENDRRILSDELQFRP